VESQSNSNYGSRLGHAPRERTPRYPDSVKLFFTLFAASVSLAQSPLGSRTYQDPQKRFQFTYPSEYGTPSQGTDNAFRARAAAIRFSDFSAGVHAGSVILGGEAVLMTGPLQLDLQAAGGLYDPITLQVFPRPIAATIQNALPELTPANLCDALAREQHLDPADPRLGALPAQTRAAIAQVDRMGNSAPKVLRCEVSDSTVTFEKEVLRGAAGPPVHLYGAVRFLPPPYSTFQLIRGTLDAQGASVIQQITAIVNSWRLE